MSSKQIQPNASTTALPAGAPFFREKLPLRVREAAVYLGVGIQTVYLWVERKQIPHLRVMVGTSGSYDRISNRFALHFDRRW